MRLTISMRLIWMILIATSALACVGLVGYSNTQKLTQDLKFTHNTIIANLEILSKAESEYLLLRVNGLYHISYDDPGKKSQHEAVIKQKVQNIESLFDQYAKNTTDANNLQLLEADKKLFANYTHALNQILAKSRENDREGTYQLQENAWKPAGEKLTQALNEHRQYNQKLAEDTEQGAIENGQFSSLLMAIATGVGVLLTALIGFISRKRINDSLQHIKATMLHVANDLDFTARAQIDGKDEIGETADAFNHLLDRLQDNIRSVATSAEQVSVAASQVAQASAQIAAASLNQSESASSMSATIEQMTVSIVHVGNRAGEVHRFSSESGQLAGNGEQVINQTVQEINIAAESVNQAADRIRQLETQSEQISGVISVIRDVADQTNLLALNAAIEAARAGEQGRGFAVVADEVRKLAERTSQSTQQIGGLIATIRSEIEVVVGDMQSGEVQMESGVALAEQAQSAIDAISHNADEINQLVHDISLALKEQTVASQDVARNVEQVAQLSEENSRAVMQTADATVYLKTLASQLDKAVHSFRL